MSREFDAWRSDSETGLNEVGPSSANSHHFFLAVQGEPEKHEFGATMLPRLIPPENSPMRLLTTFLALAFAAPAFAADANGLTKGTPTLKSATALAFSPKGILFIGDAQGATIYAVATGDTEAAGKGDVSVEKLDEKVAALLGTTAADIAISDVKVNPASGNVYLAVTRGKGKDAIPVIVRVERGGKLAEFALKDVPLASVAIPNASDKNRTEAITSIAFLENRLIVAGLSNEEFASTLRSIPYPFKDADKGSSVEVYHGAHGKFETHAPVRTFTPYKIGGADYLLAAYQCTPLVTLPVADLKPGEKVKGKTIAELGNRNRPLDMIVYTKGGKDFVLMANSARGVMKIPTDPFEKTEAITTKPKGDTAGVKYETIDELKGVLQLDRLDLERALLLVKGANGLELKSIQLP